jgi:hypothetical protein
MLQIRHSDWSFDLQIFQGTAITRRHNDAMDDSVRSCLSQRDHAESILVIADSALVINVRPPEDGIIAQADSSMGRFRIFL